MHADRAFHHVDFTQMLTEYVIHLRPVRPRRHHESAVELKHRTICSIFLSVKHHCLTLSDIFAAVCSSRISNDLYESNTTSSLEMARRFTKHDLCGVPQKAVDPGLLK